MDVIGSNNVTVIGQTDGPTLLPDHGFGCDQNLWRLVLPALARTTFLSEFLSDSRAELASVTPPTLPTPVPECAQDASAPEATATVRQIAAFAGAGP